MGVHISWNPLACNERFHRVHTGNVSRFHSLHFDRIRHTGFHPLCECVTISSNVVASDWYITDVTFD